jgi:predicted DNA-binding protein
MSEKFPMPEAKLDELATFYGAHDVSEEIEDGEVVTPQPMVTTSLRLPSHVVEMLRAEAENRGIRYTSLVRNLLVSYVSESSLSFQTLASQLLSFEREIARRLERLEELEERLVELASAAAYPDSAKQTPAPLVTESPDTTKGRRARKGAIHVVPADKGWRVVREGRQRAIARTKTQAEAVRRGREIARRDKVRFNLHRGDGTIRETDSYENEALEATG